MFQILAKKDLPFSWVLFSWTPAQAKRFPSLHRFREKFMTENRVEKLWGGEV
jgi:hypothetical protein